VPAKSLALRELKGYATYSLLHRDSEAYRQFEHRRHTVGSAVLCTSREKDSPLDEKLCGELDKHVAHRHPTIRGLSFFSKKISCLIVLFDLIMRVDAAALLNLTTFSFFTPMLPGTG